MVPYMIIGLVLNAHMQLALFILRFIFLNVYSKANKGYHLKAKEILIRFLQTAHDSNFKLKVTRLIIMWNSRNILFLGLHVEKVHKYRANLEGKNFIRRLFYGPKMCHYRYMEEKCYLHGYAIRFFLIFHCEDSLSHN
jgi:hypothetical protein